MLIYDRTAADVAAGNRKGTYRADDLNRVEEATFLLSEDMQALAATLHAYADAHKVAWDALFAPPYQPGEAEVSAKVDWGILDIPDISEMGRYLGNIKKLGGLLGLSASGLPTTMEYLNYEGANRIERYLSRAQQVFLALEAERKTRIDHAADAWPYAGEIMCGET